MKNYRPKYYLERDDEPFPLAPVAEALLEDNPEQYELDKVRQDSWDEKFDIADKVVAKDEPVRGVTISTVFVGVDRGKADPLLYESRVFGGELDGAIELAGSRKSARVAHERFVEQVRDSEGLTAIENLCDQRKSADWNF